MEKNRIWLGVFLTIVAVGAYMWWSGSRTAAPAAPGTESESPSAPVQLEAPEAAPPDAGPTLTPPSGRSGGGFADPRSPHVDSAPPPGFQSPPSNLESFGSSNSYTGQAGQGMDPGTAPPVIDNPGFVAPPPPPPQFDTEPVPFQEPVPFEEEAQPFDGTPESFAPPDAPQPQEDY